MTILTHPDTTAEEWAIRRLTYLYARAMDSNEPDVIRRFFVWRVDENSVQFYVLHKQGFLARLRPIRNNPYPCSY